MTFLAPSRLLLLAFVVALVVCVSCDSSSGGSGGETHWLYDCGTDADCGGGSLSCRCGVCTRGCNLGENCGDVSPGFICKTQTITYTGNEIVAEICEAP